MFKGQSFQTTIGGLICLAGGAYLLYMMIVKNVEVDEIHIALLAFCFGGGWIGLKAKDSNVHTETGIFRDKNVTIDK